MRHPLDVLPPGRRARVVAALSLLTLVVAVAMLRLGAPLHTAAAPLGIVSFELAATAQRAGEMLASWDESGRLAAGVSLGLDYVFLGLYSTIFAFGCLWARGPVGAAWPLLAWLAAPLAWAQWLAGLGDGIENYFLIRILLDGPRDQWALLAARAAAVKFVLLGVGLAYILAGGVITWRRRGAAASDA